MARPQAQRKSLRAPSAGTVTACKCKAAAPAAARAPRTAEPDPAHFPVRPADCPLSRLWSRSTRALPARAAALSSDRASRHQQTGQRADIGLLPAVPSRSANRRSSGEWPWLRSVISTVIHRSARAATDRRIFTSAFEDSSQAEPNAYAPVMRMELGLRFRQ